LATQPPSSDSSSTNAEIADKQRAVAESGTGARETEMRAEPHRFLRVLKILGPGLITGASDDDPTAIATYATAGASLGYATLWTALVTFPLMVTVGYISSKVGLASGMGLASVFRKRYPAGIVYPAVFALLVANTINAGADIGAIAAGINLLLPVPALALVVPVGLILVALQIWGSYRLIVTIFKWLSLALLAYVGAALLAHPEGSALLRGTFVPTIGLDAAFIATLVAIMGTNISPYLFFWQASQEVEDKTLTGRRTVWQRRGTSGPELNFALLDINIGMLFSNLVIYFVEVATAATLNVAGKTEVKSAADAAEALRPLAGNAASLLFAVGLIGAGCLAVPVLTASAAYALSEAFGWRWGLNERPERAKPFYAVIVVAMLVGVLINFLGINPIDALFWSAVLNGVLAPPLLVLLMLVANNREVMGERVNHWGTNVLGWGTTFVMFAAAVGLFLTWGH
jgi:NRAMP (natural resistance-associated macrophage protein)-like metal ion transporter